jgi:hypothetical protein
MAMTTRPTQNQVRAASLELVMMGLLRRDMDPPPVALSTEPSLLALLTPKSRRRLAHEHSISQHRLCVDRSWRLFQQQCDTRVPVERKEAPQRCGEGLWQRV